MSADTDPSLMVDALWILMGRNPESLLGFVERGTSLNDLSMITEMPAAEVEALISDQRERQIAAGFLLISLGKQAVSQAGAPLKEDTP